MSERESCAIEDCRDTVERRLRIDKDLGPFLLCEAHFQRTKYFWKEKQQTEALASLREFIRKHDGCDGAFAGASVFCVNEDCKMDRQWTLPAKETR